MGLQYFKKTRTKTYHDCSHYDVANLRNLYKNLPTNRQLIRITAKLLTQKYPDTIPVNNTATIKSTQCQQTLDKNTIQNSQCPLNDTSQARHTSTVSQ